MKHISFYKIVFLWLLPIILWGQGTYYNGLDTGSVNFISDLHNLIFPHTRITYDQFDETNVANFASRDTTSGQKVVTCVYSGENYLYTPPFTWAVYSREHTWCQSWMPSAHASGFANRPEYSDQHHLFPTNQNKANAIRSNHPEGNVVTPSYSYMSCKLGTDVNGYTVFEPRASHKGDAARALLYMAICYNGVNGYDWTFNNLNRVLVDSLNEPGGQDVDLLLQWHNQDPPDQWEKDRNEYVYSIQGNRNPFIDHPEYANVIDFRTLTKKTSPVSGVPTNYPNGYNTPTLTSNSIKITWNDPSGAVLPTGYLLEANTTNSFTDPLNGNEYTDQSNLTSGSGMVNIPYGSGQYNFTGLPNSTTYYFRLYPYNGNSTSRLYKTTSYPVSLDENYSTTAASASNGSISITSLTFTYSQDFNSLLNTGSSIVWKDDSTISGWYSNKTTYATGTGSSNTGALYSFGSAAASDRALGTIASGGTGTLYYGVRFINNSGATITTIPIHYTGEQWRDGGNVAAQKFVFEYKINASSITDAGTWIAATSLDFTGPIATATAGALDGNAIANKTSISATIPLSLQNGNEIWFRWTDINDSGNDHGLSIDDFVLNISASLLPVELTSFNAIVKGRSVELTWKTATEVNNYGFEIERKAVQGSSFAVSGSNHEPQTMNQSWSNVGFVEGAGTANAPRSYSFVDASATGKVAYRLKQIDRDGKFEYSQEIEVTVGQVPKGFILLQNYPNPFNPTTTISYTVPQNPAGRDLRVSLKIYDALGREVATLVDEIKDAGYYSVTFNASKLASGIYVMKLQCGDKMQLKKMSLIK